MNFAEFIRYCLLIKHPTRPNTLVKKKKKTRPNTSDTGCYFAIYKIMKVSFSVTKVNAIYLLNQPSQHFSCFLIVLYYITTTTIVTIKEKR